MLRMTYVILVNILILPGIIQRMKYMIKPERYNEEKCYSFARWIVRLMHRTGHIKTKGYGMENLPKEGGYMMYSNHQGKYDAYGIVGVHEKPCSVVMDEAKSWRPFVKDVLNLLHGKRISLKDTRQAMTVIMVLTGSGAAVFGVFDSEETACEAAKHFPLNFTAVCTPTEESIHFA